MRWFSWMVIGVLFGLMVFASLWTISSGRTQNQVDWIERFYLTKSAILERTAQQRRVVIVAGSNALFSFDSEQLSQTLGRPVVNFASAAGLGLRYLLERAKAQLKPGDVVLLPLEYIFYNDASVTDVTLPLHIYSHPVYLEYFPLVERASIVMHTPFQSMLESGTATEATMRNKLFESDSLNAHGDLRAEVVHQLYKDYHLSQHQYSMAYTEQFNSRSRQLLSDFVQWAHGRNIGVIAMPPAVQKHPGLQSKHAQQHKQTIRMFWEQQGIPFLVDHELLEFSKTNMFDTAYHLNERGRMLFMAKIQSLIASEIGAL